MSKAQEVIDLYEYEARRTSNFLNLWQETSEYIFPLESAITTRQIEGQVPLVDIVDTTAVFDAQDMASGLSSTMIPPGQPFFAVESTDRAANESDENKRWLSMAGEAAHAAIWSSNFLMQFDEFLKSWVVFGEGAIFSTRGKGQSLNYREHAAGSYHYLEDYQRLPDTFVEKFEYTAHQAEQAFGYENLSDEIRAASGDPKRCGDTFEFIHACRPRVKRDMAGIDALNMPYEDIYVDKKTRAIVQEGGFEEFPYHIGRWAKSAKETRGRGVGVYALPQVRSLNAMKRDLIECANRHNNPPLEILPTVEGKIDLTPGALNYASQRQSINAIQGALGNFPVTQEMIAQERAEIHRAFMIDVFNQLMGLQGDRRTTVEINERLREGLRRLAQPVGRLITEVMDKLITRSILIMIRAGMVPPPPIGLQGKGMKINYISFLVLMLRQYQTQAFMRWVSFVAQAEAVFPGAKDNVDSDLAIRDMASSFGVKTEHIRSVRQRDELRRQRAAALQAQQQAESQQAIAQGYKQTTRAPEEGSLAQKVLAGEA